MHRDNLEVNLEITLIKVLIYSNIYGLYIYNLNLENIFPNLS